MATTLQFTDGTTTIDLTDGASGYGLLYGEWAPRVATLNQSDMGPVYNDVQEEMRITIEGADTGAVMTNLQTLADLFNQANTWNANDAGITAVKIQYKHNDGDITVSSVIFATELITPREFTATGHARGYKMGVRGDEIVLRFMRLGEWLGATNTRGCATSDGNPAILTTGIFSDSFNILAPYDAQIDFYDTGALSAIDSIQNMALFFTNSANKLHIEEGENASSDTGMTDTVVAGSSGGSVIRGTFGGQNTATYAQADWASFDSGIRLINIAAMIRSQDGVTFSTYARLGTNITSGEIVNSKTVIVDGSDTNQQIIYYGPIAIRQAMSNYDIRLVFDVISGTGDFDLDYFCIIGLDENIRQFYFEKNAYRSREQLFIKHDLDSKRTPSVYMEDDPTTDTAYSGYEAGDAVLSASGNSISCLVLGGGGNSTNYVLEDSGGDELDIDLSVTRTNAYLTPPAKWSGNLAVTDRITVTDSATVTVV